MKQFYFLTFSILVCLGGIPVSGQFISVPTAGNSWVVNDLSKASGVISQSGITGWKDSSVRIRTWFRVEQAGTINISMRAKAEGKSEIQVSFLNSVKKIQLRKGLDTISLGSFNIEKAGYQFIEMRGISKTSSTYAEVPEFIVTGSSPLNFVRDDFYFGRRGPSVHLRYDIPAGASDIEWFYNEITVPEGNDVPGSYFMANGFADGYFGIQVNSETERRILFSVWSPYKTDNPGEIPEEYKIKLLKKGPDVITKEFGNEGAGGQSYRKFFWKAGNTYRFLLKGTPAESNSTDYTAWFYAPEVGEWQLIASFRRPKTNNYLKNLYSFLENFIPETGYIMRKGNYSNQWVCDTNGKWYELTGVKFTADATARKNSRLDYSGGMENGMFFLRNCGFFDDTTPMNSAFSRPANGIPPRINKEVLK